MIGKYPKNFWILDLKDDSLHEVENKEFPTESHSYKAGEDIEKMLKSWKKELKNVNLYYVLFRRLFL